MNQNNMISVQDAQEIVLSNTPTMALEKLGILSTLGRVLGEDVFAPFDIPRWDNSAMDGYAVRFEDIGAALPDHPVRLSVIEDLPAGYLPQQTVGPLQATRIMTGAPVPPGADTVVRKEDTICDGDIVQILTSPLQGENVRRRAENVRQGDLTLPRGTVLRPAHVGLLASFCRSHLPVHQVPRVAVLATGDEIMPIDGQRDPSKLVDSNTYSIAAQVKECGALPLVLGIARDDKAELLEKLRGALSAEVILTTGGVSVGDYDFVREILESLGVEMKFSRVAMRPGRPATFGTLGEKLVFGLPGNPVSCMVCFELFVRPALLKMMGYTQVLRPRIEAILAHDLETKKGLRFFLRVRLSHRDGQVYASATGNQSSGILRSMALANGLLVMPEDRETAHAGDKVTVYLLDPLFSPLPS